MDAVVVDPGGFGAAGAGSFCWQRTGCRTPQIAELVGVSRPTVIGLAGPVCDVRDRRVARRAAVGPAADGGPVADPGGDVDPAAEAARDHPLVVAVAGRSPEDRTVDGAADLAAHRVQPWRSETFKFSTDPELVAKVTDVVGLYLDPPENAIVLCVDEKSQIQALDRTQKMLPMQPGGPEKRTHDYVRHGTTTLFAALDIATGQVTGLCQPRHRHQEFLRFLKQVARRATRPRTCTW